MGSTKKSGYPLGFYVCCLTYTIERFTFYGSKPLLALFLTTAVAQGGLGIDPVQAAPIAALLTSLTYLAPIPGGWVCDNLVGARYAIPVGMILMGAGYIVGSFATGGSTTMVYAMIIIVALGTGLFKGNLAAIIGRLFDNKEQLDAAYSIQYSFVNIGAFFGSLVTGVLYLNQFAEGEVLGFRKVFMLCGVITIVGSVFFVLCWKFLQGQGKLPFKFLTDTQGNVIGQTEKPAEDKKEKSSEPLTKKEKNHVIAIVLVSLISVIFWLAYYQQDIALTFYIQDHVMRNIGSFELSPSHLTTTWNGLLCMFMTLAFAKLWSKLAARPQGDLSMFTKIAIAFLFLGLAYACLTVMDIVRLTGGADAKAHFLWIAMFNVLITIGEICFSPLGNSFVSKFAPKKYLSVLMGVWTFATFLSSTINGYVMVFVEKLGARTIFITFGVVAFVCSAAMFALTKTFERLTEE